MAAPPLPPGPTPPLAPPPPVLPPRPGLPPGPASAARPPLSSPGGAPAGGRQQVALRLAQQVSELLLRLGQTLPDQTGAIAKIVGEVTDLMQGVLSAPPEGEEGPPEGMMEPPPGMPGPVLHSPALGQPPPGMPQ